MFAGVQLDSSEAAAKLRGKWSDATHAELHHDDAVAGFEPGVGQHHADSRAGPVWFGNQQQRNRWQPARPS